MNGAQAIAESQRSERRYLHGDHETAKQGPKLEVVKDDRLTHQKVLAGVHQHLMGGLPTQCYKPEFRPELEETLQSLSRQGVLHSDETTVDLIERLKQDLLHWYIAYLDSDQREMSIEHRMSLASRAKSFQTNIRAALPFPEALVEDPQTAFLASNPLAVAAFFELWEERLSISQIESTEGKPVALPYSSLRDFVLSLLPNELPIKRTSLNRKQSKAPGVNALGKIYTLAPDLPGRLRKHFGRGFNEVLTVIQEVSPIASPTANLSSLNGEEQNSTRLIESTRDRLERIVPGLFIQAANNPKGGKELAENLAAIPAFEKEDLEEWRIANEISLEELDVLYDFLMGQAPKKLSLLEALMKRLFRGANKIKRSTQTPPLKPLLIKDKGRPIDVWTEKLLKEAGDEVKEDDQALVIETQDRIHALKEQCVAFSKEPPKLGSKEFYKWLSIAVTIGKESEPQVGLETFKEILSEMSEVGLGDFESLRSYVNGILKDQKAGRPFEDDPRYTCLIALQRGLAETIWKMTSRGFTEGADSEELRMAALILDDLQKLLTNSLGSQGFTETGPQILSSSSDLFLLALTDYYYYQNDATAIKRCLTRHKKCVGVNSSHPSAGNMEENPARMYTASKVSYLEGKYENCLALVRRLTEHDSFVGYHNDFLTRLAERAPEEDLRPDKLGLKGYAPVLIGERRFSKELVRIGLLAIKEMPKEQITDEERKELINQLRRMEGTLTPSQALNFFLAEAQSFRDLGSYADARVMIQRAWEAASGQNDYQARRIEHNEVEIDAVEVEENLAKGAITSDVQRKIWRRVVTERTLAREEASQEEDQLNLQRIWEYKGSFLEAMLQLSQVYQEDLATDPIERKGKTAFAFDEFNSRPLETWIAEANSEAIQSLKDFAIEAPRRAFKIALFVKKGLEKTLERAHAGIVKSLPILEEWEALVADLKVE